MLCSVLFIVRHCTEINVYYSKLQLSLADLSAHECRLTSSLVGKDNEHFSHGNSLDSEVIRKTFSLNFASILPSISSE